MVLLGSLTDWSGVDGRRGLQRRTGRTRIRRRVHSLVNGEHGGEGAGVGVAELAQKHWRPAQHAFSERRFGKSQWLRWACGRRPINDRERDNAVGHRDRWPVRQCRWAIPSHLHCNGALALWHSLVVVFRNGKTGGGCRTTQ